MSYISYMKRWKEYLLFKFRSLVEVKVQNVNKDRLVHIFNSFMIVNIMILEIGLLIDSIRETQTCGLKADQALG